MFPFLRKLWPYVRPYRLRLFLGVVCGILYAFSNGALLLVIKLVVNLVFGDQQRVSIAEELTRSSKLFRPLAEKLTEWLPQLQTPSSKLGLVLVISTIPAVMLFRALFGYLNIYLMTWSAARAVADLRTK